MVLEYSGVPEHGTGTRNRNKEHFWGHVPTGTGNRNKEHFWELLGTGNRNKEHFWVRLGTRNKNKEHFWARLGTRNRNKEHFWLRLGTRNRNKEHFWVRVILHVEQAIIVKNAVTKGSAVIFAKGKVTSCQVHQTKDDKKGKQPQAEAKVGTRHRYTSTRPYSRVPSYRHIARRHFQSPSIQHVSTALRTSCSQACILAMIDCSRVGCEF